MYDEYPSNIVITYCFPQSQATCSDKDGPSNSGTAPVNDTDCGIGYLSNNADYGKTCAAATCDAKGVDRDACCKICDAGYYCADSKLPCGGIGLYCPEGSGKPVVVTSGFFTTPKNASKEMTREDQVRFFLNSYSRVHCQHRLKIMFHGLFVE